MDLLFLLGRVLYGGFFFMSGINHFRNLNATATYAKSKNVPMPKLAVLGSGLLILLGGLWVMLGLYARIGLWEITIFLVPVTFMMHNFWADKDPQQKLMNKIQFMKNLALLGAALMMLIIPTPWPMSVSL